MPDQHPSVEVLLDLTLGDLQEREAFLVREHLIECDSCRAKVQDLLAEPAGPPAGEAAVSADETEAAWAKFLQSAREDGAAQPRETPSSGRPAMLPPPPTASSSIARYALAAGLALFSFGFGLLARPDEPSSVTTGSKTFAMGEKTLRSMGPDQPKRVQCANPGQGAMVWTLNVPWGLESAGRASTNLELRRKDGERIVRLENQIPSLDGTLSLIVPLELAPDGFYVVTIQESTSGASETFYFEVKCAP